MVFILAVMMAFSSMAGTMDTAPIEGGTDTYIVQYRGGVILPIGDDPTDVLVQVYNNENRLIGDCYCDSNYRFLVATYDGTRYVTDDVSVVLTNYNTIWEHTRTHTVSDKWGDYFWLTYPSRWMGPCGWLDFTIK